MRKIAIILPLSLVLGACSSFTWQGQNANLSPEAAEMGLKDVATLEREYQNERSWGELRRAVDRRTNALNNGLGNVWTTIDRHLFNASAGDPSIDHPTDQNYFSATLWQTGSGLSENVMPWLPVR
ncbi:MAG: hypothetical protein IT457_02540 [Planctomycetes bacterium]|nr:hypothetical protein [Planctomycetota bacterium]